jgi:hypothetical protein
MNARLLAAIALLLMPGGGYSRVRTESALVRAGIVTVTVNRVRRLDVMDPLPDPGADFYARVKIGDAEDTSPVSDSRNDVTPQWTFTREARTDTVAIVIQVFDRDTPEPDDHCDINPRNGVRDIRIRYNVRTGHFTGDLIGIRQRLMRVHGAGDTKRAEIWFTVDSR